MNAKNLLQLADFLTALPPSAFDMQDFCTDDQGENLRIAAHECGSVGCAVGHGPGAGFPVQPDDLDWVAYSERVFGLPVGEPTWEWCFAGGWYWTDNTPLGAAKRIRHLVEHGLPTDHYEQRRGRGYLFHG
jgi:hypothetical protein